ncbi:hypothetical protein GQ55_7G229900 [Panicum hallii var. hallii]|uniref:Uncharacterized protein n=1 Tax=Panicum hallii var. hallii TaxID=1504633 RepID=A0A2T7CY33_9POAL|nr:hypothetical protein GQ55_7G229900 [Panicum hallii var. hallii]
MGPWPHGSRSFSCLLPSPVPPCTGTGRERRPAGRRSAHRTSRMFRGVLGSRGQRFRGRVRRLLWAEERRADVDRAEGRVEQGRVFFFSLVDVRVYLVTGAFLSGCSPGAEFLLLQGGCLLWSVVRSVFGNMEWSVMQISVELNSCGLGQAYLVVCTV